MPHKGKSHESSCSHKAWKEEMAMIQAENDRLRKEKEATHDPQAQR